MPKLTIPEAAASRNIWFKVESEEQQRMFQEEFFKQGGSWCSNTTDSIYIEEAAVFALTKFGKLMWKSPTQLKEVVDYEQVQIIWQEEPTLTIDSLAPEVTLKATLNTSLNWQDTLALLTALKNEELVKDFISDKCLRRMQDAQFASLARFLLEKQQSPSYSACCVKRESEDIVKSFVLTANNFHTKKTTQTEYWYKFFRKEVERVVRQAQTGLYQEELKASTEWEGLSWERRGEE